MPDYDKKIYMQAALNEAKKALELNEVPIGAVIVCQNEIIGRGHNLKERLNDPTAHAEMIAIREAAEFLSSWRLIECDLYVTIEPCPMCAGAILQARIDKLVYGAKDKKAGAAGTLYNLLQDERFNHRLEIDSGVMAEEASHLMKTFFKKLRGGKND